MVAGVGGGGVEVGVPVVKKDVGCAVDLDVVVLDEFGLGLCAPCLGGDDASGVAIDGDVVVDEVAVMIYEGVD